VTNPSTLSVRSELTAETNGVTTRLTGDGSLLRWDLIDPVAVLAGQSGMNRASVARAADLLRSQGLVISIEEHGRQLLTLGATSSRLGSLLFRTSAIKLRAPFRLARITFAARRSP
jgi:hypothetical protein